MLLVLTLLSGNYRGMQMIMGTWSSYRALVNHVAITADRQARSYLQTALYFAWRAV